MWKDKKRKTQFAFNAEKVFLAQLSHWTLYSVIFRLLQRESVWKK